MHRGSLIRGNRQLPFKARVLQEAASADRWTSKILAYPCFGRGFREAIASTRLAILQFVLAIPRMDFKLGEFGS